MSGPTRIVDQIDTINTVLDVIVADLTEHERDCLRATLVLLKDGQSISTDALTYCDECGFPLSQCGPQDGDGEPSLDCKVCDLRADIEHITALGKQLYADRNFLRLRVAELETALTRIGEMEQENNELEGEPESWIPVMEMDGPDGAGELARSVLARKP